MTLPLVITAFSRGCFKKPPTPPCQAIARHHKGKKRRTPRLTPRVDKKGWARGDISYRVFPRCASAEGPLACARGDILHPVMLSEAKHLIFDEKRGGSSLRSERHGGGDPLPDGSERKKTPREQSFAPTEILLRPLGQSSRDKRWMETLRLALGMT